MSIERKLMGTTDGGAATYIEDVFSTYLYTGNGSTQTINNGIDLSTKGGMVWLKGRSGATPHALFDTARGAGNILASNTTAAQLTNSNWPNTLTSFSSNGFSLGNDIYSYGTNISGATYASWTFRKAPKFFDVVTYTGDGTGYERRISHSLASKPGFVVIKCTSSSGSWNTMATLSDGTQIYGGGSGTPFGLNSTNSYSGSALPGYDVLVSTTSFSPVGIGGFDTSATNATGQTYVAYLFASNAGGFGASGTDNVISCGSYLGNGSASGPTVTLGYEPQYLLVKRADTAGYSWFVFDQMRGLSYTDTSYLVTDSSSSESAWGSALFNVTATGFNVTTNNPSFNASGGTYIYMAIRRGPMKTPTSGASVFSPITSSGATGTQLTTDFPVDLQIIKWRTGVLGAYWVDRLRGVNSPNLSNSLPLLISSGTAAEQSLTSVTRAFNNTSFQVPAAFNSVSTVYENFQRAPGFFDVVCYAGNGSARTVNHNLGVAPELLIVKVRTGVTDENWTVWCKYADQSVLQGMYLNLSNPYGVQAYFWGGSGNANMTASAFSLGNAGQVNRNGNFYISYLFSSCPGVSKVGSYTGTGAAQTINCGFTGGARFVLIKRTDSTGDWYTYDTARGMVSGTDPYLLMNSTAAENTSTNYVFTSSTGFSIQAAAPAGINASGGTFIYLAIA